MQCKNPFYIRFILFTVAVGAAVAIYADLNERHLLFFVAKPLTTLCIIAAGVTAYRTYQDKSSLLLVAALSACLTGDILLLRADLFIFGLVAFLFGHLLFFAAFSSLRSTQRHYPILAALFVIAFLIFRLLYPSLGDLRIPVAVYVSVIVLMCWSGLRLQASHRQAWSHLIGLGCLLFLLSDSILAINKFSRPVPLASLWILASYWSSLTCITLGFYLSYAASMPTKSGRH